MTKTILKPCRVHWTSSPSYSGLTLTHCEGDGAPECTVVLWGFALTRGIRVELTFEDCYYARLGHKPDTDGIEAIGYEVAGQLEVSEDYLSELNRIWLETGFCPDPDFYVAIQSPWLSELPSFFQKGFYHYVISGRDGYVELIARRFKWREWDEAAFPGPVVGFGEGES